MDPILLIFSMNTKLPHYHLLKIHILPHSLEMQSFKFLDILGFIS